MCIAPRRLRDGVLTACHECWQCREHAVLDWVGRNIAESKTAKGSNAVTLTYGRNAANDADHERAVILTYSDVQKYLKRLRFDGFPVRYFVTGENGSRKGRAHWHIILYWQERVPEHVLDRNFMQDHWPHGWSFWTPVRPHSAKYNCKYILKDAGDAQAQSHLAMSKKPPLGFQFFQQRALQYVQQGLAPQDLFYTHPEAKQRNREGGHDFMKFMLGGRSAELFLSGYIDLWEKERGDKTRPKSELVDRFERFGRVVSDTLYESLILEDLQYREKDAKREASQVKAVRPWDEDLWWFNWINQAENEQERQRREIERAVRQQHEFEQWRQQDGRADLKRDAAGNFVPGARPHSGGEPAGGSLGGPQSELGRDTALDQFTRRQQSRPVGGHVPDDALGPIGRYNRDYAPKSTGAAQNGSEAEQSVDG